MKRWSAVGALCVLVGGVPAAAQDHSGGIEVPLRVEGGRLIVSVTGGGEDLDFILSTGQGVTLLSESLAARLGQEPELTMGSVKVATDQVVEISDAQLSLDGSIFDGIVGANTLNQYDVLIDAPNGRMVLKPFGRSVEWPGMVLAEPVSIQVFHGVAISLSVTVDGGEYRGSLDLGRPTSIVNQELQAAAGLGSDDTVSIGLAGATYHDQPVRSLDLEIFGRWDPEGNGFILIGAPLAWDCAISISYVHQEIRTCVP